MPTHPVIPGIEMTCALQNKNSSIHCHYHSHNAGIHCLNDMPCFSQRRGERCAPVSSLLPPAVNRITNQIILTLQESPSIKTSSKDTELALLLFIDLSMVLSKIKSSWILFFYHWCACFKFLSIVFVKHFIPLVKVLELNYIEETESYV